MSSVYVLPLRFAKMYSFSHTAAVSHVLYTLNLSINSVASGKCTCVQIFLVPQNSTPSLVWLSVCISVSSIQFRLFCPLRSFCQFPLFTLLSFSTKWEIHQNWACVQLVPKKDLKLKCNWNTTIMFSFAQTYFDNHKAQKHDKNKIKFEFRLRLNFSTLQNFN